MTVYVDHAGYRYGRMRMCHMLADSDAELHAMADMIGVARRWWQSPDTTAGSHYDICLAKRTVALRLGAQPVTTRQLAAMNARRRETGALGAPETALAWLKMYRATPRRERDLALAR